MVDIISQRDLLKHSVDPFIDELNGRLIACCRLGGSEINVKMNSDLGILLATKIDDLTSFGYHVSFIVATGGRLGPVYKGQLTFPPDTATSIVIRW